MEVKRLFIPLFFALMAGMIGNHYGLEKHEMIIGAMAITCFVVVVVITVATFTGVDFGRKLISKSFFLLIALSFLLIGHQLYSHHVEKDPLAFFTEQDSIALEAYVERVRERDFATDYEVFSPLLIINGEEVSFRERQTLRIYGIDHGYNSGDRIQIHSPVVEAVSSARPPDSSYDLYLKSRGIHNRLQASPSQVELLSKDGFYHQGFFPENRRRALNFMDHSLQEPQNQLMKSVLLGNQGFLEEDLREAFAQTGTAHIIAVSGLHVGILVIVFTLFFRALGIGKQLYLWMILGILFLYGYLIAFPISMVRAGMMYGLYILAFYQHRPYDGLHALAVVGIISLFVNPLALFTVSFQLSFTATASILLLYSKFDKGLSFLPKLLRSLVAVTLAAQLGTLPLMAYYFGQISIISIGANLLLMPTMGMLLSLGITGVFLGLIIEPLGMAVNVFTNGLLTYQIALVRFLQKIPGAFMEIGTFHFGWVIGYYIIIVSIYLYIEKRGFDYDMERIQKTPAAG
ncbi:ComEC/Rec2 family competence protein [Isachenkonia alkalipeptolytica]|uniref:ComEC/Rec2 family competence protein n=1 Tax=Isachenkonia alkalipeptolytica TaxID=2565777 RepID=UPI00136C0F6E|nr:ComEC/Rec2 family competence protein [Isachenkonia alkalipeptolytica]